MFFKMFADDDDEKLKLAVMEFEDQSGKLSKKMISSATEYIRGAFVASNKFIVIAKERQENAMIKQMKKESYKVCNDKNCQIPLGQALSADTILRTTITFFAKKYTITSELIDLAKEATTKGAKATFNGSEESLNEALDEIVSQIIGKKVQKEKPVQNSLDHEACEYAKQDATVSTWKQYLDEFPDGECSTEAAEAIDKLACSHAEKANSIEGWELYLKYQSKGKCSFKAKAEIKKMRKEKEAAYLKGRKIGNLIWSDRSSQEIVCEAAKQYCEDLTEGGFTDWRLPNIDELRLLVKNCPAIESGGECRISEKKGILSWNDNLGDCGCFCTVSRSQSKGCSIYYDNYSKFGDEGALCSSSYESSSGSTWIWLIDFTDGQLVTGGGPRGVRCVR